jgi:TetR/AcrR family transcriptional regulator of autoinduction and epiphytic fitness
MLGLLEQGQLRPTAAHIAERAGLSVRSVFQHFADMDDLFLAVADQQVSRVADLYAAGDYAGEDLETRLLRWAERRRRLHEGTAPVRRAALFQERFSPTLASRLNFARRLNRYDVVAAFSPEFGELDPDAPGADWRLEAIHAIGSFRHWDVLRNSSGLSEEAARDLLAATVRAILAA